MKSYFENVERRAALVAEAMSWMGTPFRAYTAVRGGGVDCVSLCLAMYQAVGFLPVLTLPQYRVGAGAHAEDSQLEKVIREIGRFAGGTPAPPYMVGDLLGFNLGRVCHHAGVVVNETEFIHARRGYGVALGSLADPFWKGKMEYQWRPVEI